MSNGLAFLLLSGLFGLPTLLVVRARTERAAVYLYVYLGLLLTLGGLLGQVLSLEFTVPLLGPAVVSAGSIAFGAFMSSAVLLVIVTLDMSAMRRVAVLVVFVNAVVACTFLLVGVALRSGATNPFDVDPRLFDFSLRLLVTGGVLIIVELFALAALLELAKRSTRTRFTFGATALAAFVLVVTIDGLLFFVAGFPFAPDLITLITGGMRSKLVVGVAFALPLTAALWVARERTDDFRATPLELQYLVVAPRDHLLDRIHEAARSRELLQARMSRVTEGMSDGLVLCGLDGRVEDVNLAGAELLRLDRERIVGRDLEEVLGVGPAAEEQPELLTATNGRKLQVRLHRSSTGSVVIFRDATAQARRAESLERARSAELSALNHQVEAELVKSSLLTAASHEFRTPVTVIYAAAKTLVDHAAEIGSEQRHLLEASLLRHAERLTTLVEDLFELGQTEAAAIEAPEREHAPVDLVGIVRDAIADSGIADRVILDAPPVAECPVHQVAVRRVVDHLLSNVAKYAPEGPCHVTVELSGDGCRLVVEDAGPGLPTELHEEVFSPFVRADHDHPRPGTGIGLSVVRHLAELTGGSAVIVPSQVGLRVAVEIGGRSSLRLDRRAAEEDFQGESHQ